MGLGDRLSQSLNGETVQYTLDLNAGLTQVLADNSNTYLYGLNRVGQYGPGGWSYHLPDALGSVRQMADPAAAATFAQAYEPYGNVLEVAGEARTPYGFAGEWMDRTGLVHLRARYYAPYTGTFIQPDPWPGSPMIPDTLHPYLYAGANPVVYRDPSGRCYGDFDFLRNYEGQSCENLDMALTILANPEASDAEKRLAGGYLGAWGIGHLYLGAGMAALMVANIGISAIGSAGGVGYSTLKYSLAASGACGCEGQEWANSVSFGKYVVKSGLLGGAISGTFGGAIQALPMSLVPYAQVGVGVTNIGVSGIAAYNTVAGALDRGEVSPCDALDLAVQGVSAYLGFRMVGSGFASFQARRVGFSDEAQLLDHFNRHVPRLRSRNPAEYQARAAKFLTGRPGQGVLEIIRSGNGDIVRYNPVTDEFGVLTSQGVIRTFFIPDPDIHGYPTNLDYFYAQR